MSKVPVSVCIIAKDEERYMEECLRRLVGYGFEIIVTDTGSTDHTKEIASRYADKVLDFKWIDDFSAARNFCADNASNNWIMAIDCDEYVTKLAVPQLRILMQKFPKYTGNINITSVVYHESGEKVYDEMSVPRFYNRKIFRFSNAIHEQLVGISPSAMKKTFVLPMEVIHQGYAISREEMDAKQKRNLELLHRALEREPDNPYILFQIGQSEYIIGNHEGSIEYYERALSLNPDMNLQFVHILIYDLGVAYKETGRIAEAIEHMDRYADICKEAKYVYLHGVVYIANKEFIKALLCFIKAVSLPDAGNMGEALLDCYENIVILYNKMGEYDMANMFVAKRDALRAEKERVLSV
jgi:glycosyltransferase involved in cell wall biosynthesis